MQPDQLSLTLSAIADPTRRAILTRLMDGEASVKEIAAPFEMSIPAICKHLKVLEGAGLISRGRNAQLRPCRLEAQPLREAVGWIEEFSSFWDTSLNRLDGLLERLQATDPTGKKN
ncbi:metalloregulator ArsR/SmtB family transcription factor [Devosia sp. Root105]|uniref:ArsR/SmtB family transcription factor n=1 Tax=Devosia sp. Root105 TaxID=1736423 RepID=UPI0006FEE7C0|nr:metalloregulator ArsR/SmtB family transcription factor [Devosia sp. Root105]KQU93416.1 ArsR family transcriptional regulator [Devosia sp. Root105]